MSNLRTILFLAASPAGTSQLRLGQELRDISTGLQRSQKRDLFRLEQRLAVRPRDVQRAMLDLTPQIVHFSGHGTGTAGLVFENEQGTSQLVDGPALASLFALFADQVSCVLLNGCYSEVQAAAISQHIKYVIGMNKAIGDRSAIEFAVGFYDALGSGRSIEFAYNFGCSAIQLAGSSEHLTPVLLNNEQLKLASTAQIPFDDYTTAATTTSKSSDTLNRDIQFSPPNTPASSPSTLPSSEKETIEQPETNSGSAPSDSQKTGVSSRLNSLKRHARQSLITSAGVVVAVTGVRLLGLLQPIELNLYDHLLRLRPHSDNSSRIVVIEATEQDHKVKLEKNETGEGAVSHEALDDVLQQLEQADYKPAVIALDLYRDSKNDPLIERFRQTPNLFAVCETPNSGGSGGVDPPNPSGIPAEQVGFSNFIFDEDNVLRRQLIEAPPKADHPCQSRQSLGLLVALRYLQQQLDDGIDEQTIWTDQDDLLLNGQIIRRIDSYGFGGYQYVDAKGIQFLLNYQAPQESLRDSFNHFRLEDVRQGKIASEYLKDKIVLIGVTSRQEAVDYFPTPYGMIAGVTIHAHMIDQIVSTALEGRASIWVWPQWGEGLWVIGWTIAGAFLGASHPTHRRWLIVNVTGIILIYGLCVGTMTLQSGWIPMLPAMIGFVLSGNIVHYRYYGVVLEGSSKSH